MNYVPTLVDKLAHVKSSVWVLALLSIHAGLLAGGAALHSPTIDEVGHMAGGLGIWQAGRFDLYCVNPPLVRMIAVLPVLLDRPQVDWGKPQQHPVHRQEFELGRKLIADTGPRAFWYFTWARWACIPFSLLGGYLCYRWARELYGDAAGLMALTLWCLCPNILAHAQLITPDTGAAAFGLLATYTFWHWLKAPSWSSTLLAGVALGFAELSKTSWVLLFALWPALWLACRCTRPAPSPGPWRRVEIAQLALILTTAVYFINLGFGFDRSFTKLKDFRFVSTQLRSDEPITPGKPALNNRFGGDWLGEVPVPLPRYYVLGIDVQKHDFEANMRSYLRGELRDDGWWYYYLYALAVKVPLGTWVLGFTAIILTQWRPVGTAGWRDDLVLLAPAAALLILVSSQTGINNHLRYVLPALPFAYIAASRTAWVFSRPGWKAQLVVAGALFWSAGSSMWYYPHSLSYFNELAEGPLNGHYHLIDSNIDWGQDLFFLKRWLKAHPEARPLGLAYFGHFDPRVAGIEFELPPLVPRPEGRDRNPAVVTPTPQPGWYAVSVNLLHGYTYTIADGRGGLKYLDKPYVAYFLDFQPVARAGYSVYIYHLTADDCQAWQQSLLASFCR